MKKVIGVMIATLLVIGLAACGNGKSSGGASKGGGSGKSDEIVIGMSFPAADHGWMAALIDNAKKEAEGQHVKYKISTASDPNQQANDVQDLITQKVDVIVMDPIESDALTPVGQKVKDAGIPLVIVDRELTNDSATAVIKGDNEGIGKNAGKYIGELLGGKGKVAILSGPPSSVTTLRTNGFKDAIKSYPDIKVVAEQSGDFQQEKSLSVMKNILQSQSHLDAIYTEDDEMALGALQAIKEANRTDIKVVTGAGGEKNIFEDIKNDNTAMKATFLYSPTMSKDAVDLAIKIAKGEKPEQKINVIEATEVTKSNVDKYYDADSKY